MGQAGQARSHSRQVPSTWAKFTWPHGELCKVGLSLFSQEESR